MTIFQNIIPLLGAFLSGFGTWIIAFIAFGVICCIPSVIREIVSYV